MPSNLRAKCIIVGDPGVGKSAVTQVFHSDGSHFPKNYQMTTFVELMTKIVTIPDTHDTLELFILDTSGKEIFSDLVQKMLDHPSMVVVVFDVTNETSYNSCAKWLERVRAQKPNIQFPGVLLGNKADLDQRRMISYKEAKQFAESNGLDYFECSAKEMQNVDQPFLHLATAYHKLYQDKIEIFKSLV